jgi:hypothetical protein
MTDTHFHQKNEAARLLAGFRTQRNKGSLEVEQVESLARRAADLIIERSLEGGDGFRDAVKLLCEISSSEDHDVARAGVRALFPGLIERLNDSFDPAACKLYDRIFAQVIDYFRRLPQAKEFDEALRGFGLIDETDLLTRKSSILDPRSPKSSYSPALPSGPTWPSQA